MTSFPVPFPRGEDPGDGLTTSVSDMPWRKSSFRQRRIWGGRLATRSSAVDGGWFHDARTIGNRLLKHRNKQAGDISQQRQHGPSVVPPYLGDMPSVPESEQGREYRHAMEGHRNSCEDYGSSSIAPSRGKKVTNQCPIPGKEHRVECQWVFLATSVDLQFYPCAMQPMP